MSTHNFDRSQEQPIYYIPNGAIYLISHDLFNKDMNPLQCDPIPYIMSEEDSMDIDTKFDFDLANLLMKEIEDINEKEY